MNRGAYRGAPLGRRKAVPTRFSGCRMTNQAATLSMPNSTLVAMPWDTKIFDTDNYWDPQVPTRFTIPHDGFYRVGGGATPPLSTGTKGWIRLSKWTKDKGAGLGSTQEFFGTTAPGNLITLTLYTIGVEQFAAGDYVEIGVEQQVGSTQSYAGFATATDESLCHGWIERLG